MDERDTELVIQWVLTGLAVAIMVLRLALRKRHRGVWETGDYLTMAAIVTILVRGAVIHVAQVYGTNAHAITHPLSPVEIQQRVIGSKLTMVNRALYSVYCWLQKCVVMCVLQHVLQGLQSQQIVKFYWATLAVTFVAAFAMTFVECHPFKLYWQVVPHPGNCSKGSLQLLVFSILNMLTDVMLIILPLPQLFRIKRPMASKLRLIGLFLVGLSIVAVTMTRLLMNRLKFHRSGNSHAVANVEIFFAAFVANAPTIYGLLNMEIKQRTKPSGGGGATWQNSWNVSAVRTTTTTTANDERDRFSVPGRRPPNRKYGSLRGETASDEEVMIEMSHDMKEQMIHCTTDIHISTKSTG